MRIGVNTLFLIPGEVGGSETYLCDTIEAIPSQAEDLTLVLFTNIENDGFLRQRFAETNAFEFVRLDIRARDRRRRILREQIELPLAVCRAHLDVLWSPGYTAPLLAPCPQVVTILDMQYKSHPEDLTFAARWATHVLVMLGAKRARRLLALSEFAREEIARYTGVRRDKIVVSPLAASVEFGLALPEAERSASVRRLTGAAGPYMLCVANTYPHKNLAALVGAFGRLAKRIPHRLVLVGKPRLGEAAVQSALKALPDDGRFVRIDGVSRRDLAALYQGADVFVFPSLYEGFGLPVLEAMMARTPVVTTRRASIPEIAGEDAVYCATPDEAGLAAAMEAVLTWPPAQRTARVESAQRRAQTFDWNRTATITLECLRQAAD